MMWLALQMLRALPMWLIVCAIRPFLPATHPFKRRMTLALWVMNATPLATAIADVLWIQFVWVVITVAIYRTFLSG